MPADLAEVPHHLVGDLDLSQGSSAGDYARLAHGAIDAILARGRTPIVAGGTGLYMRAALADLAFPPRAPVQIRDAVERLVAADPGAAAAELRDRDPKRAARVDLRNPRRVARALELARAGIQPAARSRLWDGATRLPTVLVGVTRPLEVLDRLIATRVERELADGLVAEIERALATPGFSRTARQIIGVAEVAAVRDGRARRDDLPPILAARTRRLARAQLAWLRKTPGVRLLDLGDAPAGVALPRLLAMWRDDP